MNVKVTTKLERIPGTQLNPGVYAEQATMCFEVEADVPSEARKTAVQHFNKNWSEQYTMLSCVCTGRDTVQILCRRGRPKPVVPKGWAHKGPAGSRGIRKL